MASSLHTEVLAANKAYAETFGDKSQLALPPARKAAFLVCMDARLDPAKFAGLHEGDAHVIRNAGGRASEDAIRRCAHACWARAMNAAFDRCPLAHSIGAALFLPTNTISRTRTHARTHARTAS